MYTKSLITVDSNIKFAFSFARDNTRQELEHLRRFSDLF